MDAEYKDEIGRLETTELPKLVLANLEYELSKKSKLNFLLLDEKGRMHWRYSLVCEKGKRTIELYLPKLKNGEYAVWIEFNEETIVRNISITKGQKKGWLYQLKKWLGHTIPKPKERR